jgi:hypothetical protein
VPKLKDIETDYEKARDLVRFLNFGKNTAHKRHLFFGEASG